MVVGSKEDMELAAPAEQAVRGCGARTIGCHALRWCTFRADVSSDYVSPHSCSLECDSGSFPLRF